MIDNCSRRTRAAISPALGGVATSFVRGLGQMVSRVGHAPKNAYPDTSRTAAEALIGDWERLGGDMHKVANKILPLGIE